MKLNQNKDRLTINLSTELTAPQIEQLIIDLALLRNKMTPEVPLTLPPSDANLLTQDDARFSIALLDSGMFRLYFRNRGAGWMVYTLQPAKAIALAEYIRTRTIKSQSGADLPPAHDTH